VELLFYEDMPYVAELGGTGDATLLFTQGLTRWLLPIGLELSRKAASLGVYRSQFELASMQRTVSTYAWNGDAWVAVGFRGAAGAFGNYEQARADHGWFFNLTTRYRIRLIEDLSDRKMVQSWNAVTEQAQHQLGWFQSPQWVVPWWETLGSGTKPIVLGVYAGDELVAIAPWCVSGDVVRCMGDPLNDVNRVPTRSGHDEDAVLRALVHGLWDLLKDHRSSPRVLLLECWPTCLPDLDDGWTSVEERRPLASPVLKFSGDFDSYLKSLLPHVRRKLAQTLRRLYRAMPKIRLEIATKPPRILELGNAMLRLREQTLGPRGLLSDCEPASREEPFRKLLAQVVNNGGPGQQAILGALVYEDQVIAGGLYFRWGSILMKYMQGWSLQHRQWSPGTVLDIEMIRDSLASGLEVLEFGRGDEDYKRRLGAQMHWLHNYAITPRNEPRAALETSL